MSYSDFPIPKEWPTYLPHKFIDKYLNMYSEEFKLTSHIKFNRHVTKVEPELDQETNLHTGKWKVTIKKAKRKQPKPRARVFSDPPNSNFIPSTYNEQRSRSRPPPSKTTNNSVPHRGVWSPLDRAKSPNPPPSVYEMSRTNSSSPIAMARSKSSRGPETSHGIAMSRSKSSRVEFTFSKKDISGHERQNNKREDIGVSLASSLKDLLNSSPQSRRHEEIEDEDELSWCNACKGS